MVDLAAYSLEVDEVSAFRVTNATGTSEEQLFQQLDTLGYEIESDRRYSRDIAFRWARFFTSPLSIGSDAVEIMGIVVVACMRARTAGVDAPKARPAAAPPTRLQAR